MDEEHTFWKASDGFDRAYLPRALRSLPYSEVELISRSQQFVLLLLVFYLAEALYPFPRVYGIESVFCKALYIWAMPCCTGLWFSLRGSSLHFRANPSRQFLCRAMLEIELNAADLENLYCTAGVAVFLPGTVQTMAPLDCRNREPDKARPTMVRTVLGPVAVTSGGSICSRQDY